jgi:hypothetical protein
MDGQIDNSNYGLPITLLSYTMRLEHLNISTQKHLLYAFNYVSAGIHKHL